MKYQSTIDLHAHSTASDGELTPTELVKMAAHNGVETLALTDHDTVAGLSEAQTAATQYNINLINGIELSMRWNNKTIHIVGLNIDANSKAIIDSTIYLNQLREERAIKIGDKLKKTGINNAYDNAKQLAGKGTVTRQHFAQFLVNNNYAKNYADVFKHFLVRNKPGYVSVEWPDLDETINNINSAGGVAVIAHPLRYKMTATKLRKLISEFKDVGGKAIEVVTGNNNKDEIITVTNYAKKYDMAASAGSDYHSGKTPWAKLGNLTTIPKELTPVWELW
ncbi:MAG: PHP domain-containing protein [Proteobacteria bacterium]|nr:PHP domain-containing protein [Pseudomonadota bacterium]NOG61146.1 PHP domain-containing protein [Pseudomonadota bacterium]